MTISMPKSSHISKVSGHGFAAALQIELGQHGRRVTEDWLRPPARLTALLSHPE
jgi:hypothetical protein